MKLQTNVLLTFLALCRHNEPGSEQHAGPTTQGLVLFSFTITVCDFSPVRSCVIVCHAFATLVDGVF